MIEKYHTFYRDMLHVHLYFLYVIFLNQSLDPYDSHMDHYGSYKSNS
jgi:hypothetical protein